LAIAGNSLSDEGVAFADITGAARDNGDLAAELDNKFGKDNLLFTQFWL